ncbi:DNA polymerase III subunit alpha [Paenibacillus sp. J2TS4]|uniref:DNA polymerase III subunit alpha n=1 Tax=Paenibacillus sp. J2TS4 TaxID=2807194 RepID=UPI001B0922A9|nr:DNA polymerase III subunit alpha [Paenibacillus sp. J2TS4]GIP33698.1 DNA-directed DNA polymerase [Paenibacillus sp. J2TS4]
MNGFVHLHVHSEYSLLDGAARIEELVDQAARLGMSSLALTDHGVMYGAIAFYKECVRRGIRPIIGCEAYFTSGSLHERGSRQDQPIYHLILLAKNEKGYRNLMKLCSIGHLEGFHYKPRIDHDHLARYSDGLICLSSCLGGEISQLLLHDKYEEAKEAALRYYGVFGEDYYLEIQDHGLMEQKKVAQEMIRLSRETGIPLVVTNDVHYVRPEDQAVQDILICIGTGKTIDDPERFKMETTQLYLKSGEEMARLFAHVPEALANTAVIADKCQLELQLGRTILPSFEPIPDSMSAGQYLAELCQQGLKRRYGGREEWEDAEYRRKLEERLNYELDVIDRMGFSDYFLIVWDFIRFAHERGIATGPGRGSSAGSLVAYVLSITDVDPIRYRLLFERFLNPERVSMPDIDIDFSDVRRDEVIEYVSSKYGAEHVAQIVTFGTMAARGAVRDVGRVLNMPYHEVDRAAKMIPNFLGISLERALEVNPDLQALCSRNPKTEELIQMARKVEGMPRHASTHAAGVVISREPLTDYVPLQEGADGIPLTQYSMEHLESVGLLKMDFLGLRTLSIIERTLKFVLEQCGEAIDFSQSLYDDPDTYRLLGRGDTTGVFQLESAGMRRVLKELKPSEFEDIISVNALYRPGPMDFIPKFIQAKHGLTEIEYPHESLVSILEDTYGIIVYQEQIMQIAATMAGFTLGQADLLRRAVSKKKREVLDEQRAFFVAGSVRQGRTEEEANRVYDMIVRFADYGFPRAHATAYGVLAYQTAYLKAHYPVQFMASMLTAVMGSHRKVAEYVDECRRMGIVVLAPDVNESGYYFTPVEGEVSSPALAEGTSIESGAVDKAEENLESVSPAREGTLGSIRFGLAAIKNVGTHAIEAILQAREERPFGDLLDFCRRVDLRVCNKRVIESLVQAGAFGSLPGHRAQLLTILDETVEAAVKWKKESEDLQLHLFGFTEEANWVIEYPEVRPYTRMEQLELERELLGFYLSGHPLDAYEEGLRESESDAVHSLAELPDNNQALVAGMVVSMRTIVTKKGQQMAFMELEDRIDRVEVVIFPEAWKKYGSLVDKGKLLLVKAKIQHQDDAVKLLAEQLYALEEEAAWNELRRWPLQQRRARAGAGRSLAGAPASAAAARGGAASPGAAARGSAAHADAAYGAAPQASAAAGTHSGASAAPRSAPASAAGGPQGPRAAAARTGGGQPASRGQPASQRVYIKIDPLHEAPRTLEALQRLLQGQPGPLPVVLFYEREQKTVMLSERYLVKPSPVLFQQIEKLLGDGTVRVK